MSKLVKGAIFGNFPVLKCQWPWNHAEERLELFAAGAKRCPSFKNESREMGPGWVESARMRQRCRNSPAQERAGCDQILDVTDLP